MPKKMIRVTGAVIVREGLILAARRGEGKPLAGYWEFPGGKIEPAETPEASLVRELREELRCSATVGEFITTTDYEYDFGIVSLTTYYCELISGEPELTEHSEIRWLEPSTLPELEWAPADIPAVHLIADRFSRN